MNIKNTQVLAIFFIIIIAFLVNLSFADEPLFEVKDEEGNPVFAVYPDGIRVMTAEGDTLMTVVDDSIRFWVKEGDSRGVASRSFMIGQAGASRFDANPILTVKPK